MSKLTRRLIKNRKNRTIKVGGDNIPKLQEKREGLLDIVGDKIYNTASSVGEKALDTGLNIVGLERKDKKIDETESKIDENLEKMGNTATGIISNVSNVVDKTGAALIENVNEVLGSNIVKETTAEAAENTAELIKEGAEKFNEAINDPIVKAEVVEAIDNAADIATIGIKSFEKPVDELTDVAAKSFQKGQTALAEGAVKTGAAIVAALPGIGGLIDLAMAFNSASRAGKAVAEASSETIEALSDAIIDTKNSFQDGMKELEEKKKLANQISNRTTKSINQFENPILKANQTGGKKTKRSFLKRKAKSKRVKFAI